MEQTQTALEQRMTILRQAFASDTMAAFRPMAISEVARVLRGTVSNAKARAEKQGIAGFDHKAVSAKIEELAKAESLESIVASVASITEACEEIPKQEAGAALLPLTEAELATLAPIYSVLQEFAASNGMGLPALCSMVRRALLTWRQVPKQEGQEGPEDNEPEERN